MDIQQHSPPNVGENIAQRALELSNELYTNKSIKPYDPKLSEQIAGYNRLLQADLDVGRRVRCLVANQSSGGDWGLNRGGLNYLLNSLKDGKIVVGVVVLTKKSEVVNKKLVTDVWENVKDASWLDLGRGEFCWVDAEFCLIGRDRNKFITDPDAPF